MTQHMGGRLGLKAWSDYSLSSSSTTELLPSQEHWGRGSGRELPATHDPKEQADPS